MKRQKIKILEGDFFSVPVPTVSGYAVGRIARFTGLKFPILVYFFGELFPQIPSSECLESYEAKDAYNITNTVLDAIRDGTWSVVPSSSGFKREDWPVPLFADDHPAFIEQGRVFRHDDNGGFANYPEVRIDRNMVRCFPSRAIPYRAAMEWHLKSYFTDSFYPYDPASRNSPPWFHGLPDPGLTTTVLRAMNAATGRVVDLTGGKLDVRIGRKRGRWNVPL